MRTEDLILVSVDDHVIEPRGMFDGLLPAKYQDKAPQLIRQADGTDSGTTTATRSPTSASTPSSAARPRSTGSSRRRSTTCGSAATTSTSGCATCRSTACSAPCASPPSPSSAASSSPAAQDKDEALAMVRAYNDWHIDRWCGAEPGRFIPLSIPVIWDPELAAAEVRRVAKKGCHAVTFSENPEKLGWPSLHIEPLGPLLDGLRRRGHGRLHAPRLVVPDARHLDRRAHRRDDQPAAHEHGAGGGRPPVVARAAQVHGPALRPLRGRHRLDPLRPRAHRLRVPAPPQVDGPGLRRPCCRARSSRTGSSPASSTTPSGSRAGTT